MKVPAAILTFIMVQGLFFLFGAFVANSFDLAEWNRDGRFMTALLGFVAGFGLALTTYNSMEAK